MPIKLWLVWQGWFDMQPDSVIKADGDETVYLLTYDYEKVMCSHVGSTCRWEKLPLFMVLKKKTFWRAINYKLVQLVDGKKKKSFETPLKNFYSEWMAIVVMNLLLQEVGRKKWLVTLICIGVTHVSFGFMRLYSKWLGCDELQEKLHL